MIPFKIFLFQIIEVGKFHCEAFCLEEHEIRKTIMLKQLLFLRSVLSNSTVAYALSIMSHFHHIFLDLSVITLLTIP